MIFGIFRHWLQGEIPGFIDAVGLVDITHHRIRKPVLNQARCISLLVGVVEIMILKLGISPKVMLFFSRMNDSSQTEGFLLGGRL